MKNIILTSLLSLTLIQGAFTALNYWLKSQVQDVCEEAVNQYGTGKFEALILMLHSDSAILEDKNKAIWALGKSRDLRAIPLLKALETHRECEHEKFVCQRELQKAIQTLEKERVDLFTYR